MQTSEEIEEILEQPPAISASPAQKWKRFALPKPVELILAFLLILIVMQWIEFGGRAILDNDGFYHMRWSRTLREQFPHLPKFQSLPLTTLNEKDYVDHHYLFHVLLMPFTFGDDMWTGAKWAAVVFSSVGILSLFALLVAFNVRFRWLWLAPILASSEPFLYRMSMTRAPALSLALVGLGAYLILKRKYVWLTIVSFVFVWYYSLFPLVFVFAAFYALAVYLAERRIEWRAPLATFTGIAAGLVINPYFPKNFRLLYEHVMMKINTSSGYSVNVGVEWYPYESWDLLRLCGLAFVIFFAGFAAFEYRRRAQDLKPLFFLFIALFFLLWTFKSRRFVEYWPPFGVLFAAFTISPRVAQFDRSWFKHERERIVAGVAAALAVVIISASMIVTVFEAHKEMHDETEPDAYKGACEWISRNVPQGAMIFNTDWDDFPMLYYFNPNNPYIVGLDPTYLYDRDHELWKLYASITLGEVEDPAELIRQRYGAEYVFTDNQHTDFLDNANNSGKFETVYKDGYTTVLHIRSEEEIKKIDSQQQKTEPQDGSDDGDDSDDSSQKQ